MERKILWVLSFLVIFILWLKLEPISPTKPSSTVIEKPTPSPTKPSNKYSLTEENSPMDEEIELKNQTSPPEEPTQAISEDIPPDFASISDIQDRKDTFFNYLLPFVIEKNTLLIRDREKIYTILANKEPPSREEKRWLKALREIFKLEKVDVFTDRKSVV